MLCLLLPLLTFLALYLQAFETLPKLPQPYLDLVLPGVLTINWAIAFYLFDKKIKSIRNDQGLRAKLEKYFALTIVRYIQITGGHLFLAAGFYITQEDVVTGIFVASMVLAGLLWPTSAKVCKDLKLRGDEREMVYYKKDEL